MKLQIIKLLFAIASITILNQSCKKNWLDAKPDQSLAIPHTLKDYKALMSASTIDPGFNDSYCTITELCAGDFYVIADPNIPYYNNLTASQITNLYNRWLDPSAFTGSGNVNHEKNFYSWKNDPWTNNNNYTIWGVPYNKILYTNIVLEGIEKIDTANSSEGREWREVKGMALFHRAVAHYEIAKQFCKTYDQSTALNDLGIPLRLNSNFNEKSERASIEESYKQITNDLKIAAELLPTETPLSQINKCLPTKLAAYAMLARVYISMSSYDNALLFADKALTMYNQLLDYNTEIPLYPINNATNISIPQFSKEVIFQMRGFQYGFTGLAFINVDSSLFKSYDNNDLRKQVYFKMPTTGSANNRNRALYRGGYDGSPEFWTGLATDELYLIRAECYARKGNKDLALNDLNTLMIKRWSITSWQPFTANDANEALAKILVERRKELIFRGLRWTDLKRLNREPQFATTLTKKIEGQTLTLQPNSLLYTFLIPPNVIQLSGIQQNPR